MDFKEALQELKDGKRIRRKGWPHAVHLELGDNGLIKSYFEQYDHFIYGLDIFMSEGWIVIGEEVELPFSEIIKPLVQGKKVKFKDWSSDCFIEASKAGKEFFIRNIVERHFVPSFECLSSSDWETI